MRICCVLITIIPLFKIPQCFLNYGATLVSFLLALFLSPFLLCSMNNYSTETQLKYQVLVKSFPNLCGHSFPLRSYSSLNMPGM